MLKDLLEQKGVSVYRAAKDMDISYSTLNDLVIEKTDIQNTSSNILYRLAKYLDVSMELLYENSIPETMLIYLYNEGRDVVIEFNSSRVQYLGPKNLISFHRINKVSSDVIYVDCYFKDEMGKIYAEEDYVDLKDALIDVSFEGILSRPYTVQIGRPSDKYGKRILDDSILISDSMAVLFYIDNDIPDRCVQVINVNRPNYKTVLRLKDMAVVYTNMSNRMLKRATDAVKRNLEEIYEASEEVYKNA